MNRLGGATSGHEYTEHSKHSCLVLCSYNIWTIWLDIGTIYNIVITSYSSYSSSDVTQQPTSGIGRLIVEVSRSHTIRKTRLV